MMTLFAILTIQFSQSQPLYLQAPETIQLTYRGSGRKDEPEAPNSATGQSRAS
jgi:hypothetical protein